MPRYEYRCHTCDSGFELQRPMSQSGDPAVCPEGHRDTVRMLSAFAAVGASGEAAPPVGPCGRACDCYPE